MSEGKKKKKKTTVAAVESQIGVLVKLTTAQLEAIDSRASVAGVSRRAWMRTALLRTAGRKDLDRPFPVTGRPRKE